MTPKNTICLWFDKDAAEAASFYASTFPDSKVTAVHKAPSDFPGGKAGDVRQVDRRVLVPGEPDVPNLPGFRAASTASCAPPLAKIRSGSSSRMISWR